MDIIVGFILTSLLVSAGVVITVLINKVRKNIEKFSELKKERDKILSQKKSSEVRLGKIGENMAPFFAEWPYDPNKFRFIGDPIDGLQFTDDGVIFVEIKTGKARLTNGQKSIKNMVKEGKVKFVTFRVDESGCTLKVEGQ